MEFPRYLLPSIEQFLEENHLSKTAERLRKEASMKPNEGQVRAPDLKEMYQLYLEHKPTVAQPEVPQREEQKKRKRKEKKSKTGEAAAQCKRVKVEAAIETDAADPEKKTEKKCKKKGKKKEKKAEGKEDKKERKKKKKKAKKLPMNGDAVATKEGNEEGASKEDEKQPVIPQPQEEGIKEPKTEQEVSKELDAATPKMKAKTSKAPFKRVREEEVVINDQRLADNSYRGQDGWGMKAHSVLKQVKGRNFRHEKTKKKRGSYRGGTIDSGRVNSIKFDD